MRRHEALLLLLRQDVWGALAMAACRPNLAALSHACQVSQGLAVLRYVLHAFEIYLGMHNVSACPSMLS